MNTAVTQFQPEKFKQDRPKRDALIEYGKKLGAQTGDWSVVESSVDKMLISIQELLAWWGENVQHGGDRSKSADRGTCIPMREAESALGVTNQQVSRWSGALGDEDARDKYRLKLLGPVYRKVFGITHGTQDTGMDEWYTPEKYVGSARKVLGHIELDPASSAEAQETVQAKRYLTIKDNALEHEWKADTVWMNPPYSTEKVLDFILKLVSELETGNVGSAILLTNSLTDTSWFHIAEAAANLICFTRGRIKFIKEGEAGGSPTFGQAFFYFGDEPETFREHFLEHGFIR